MYLIISPHQTDPDPCVAAFIYLSVFVFSLIVTGKFTKFQMQMDKFRQQAEVWEGKSVNAEMQRKKDGKRLDALEAAK